MRDGPCLPWEPHSRTQGTATNPLDNQLAHRPAPAVRAHTHARARHVYVGAAELARALWACPSCSPMSSFTPTGDLAG